MTYQQIVIGIAVFMSILFVILLGTKVAYGFFNSTTGNDNLDANNPNNAANIIIQYCIDHADRVVAGENVVQTLVASGLVPPYYNDKTCEQVQQEYRFEVRIEEGVQSFSRSLGID